MSTEGSGRSLGLVGAGFMGSGIAETAARVGIAVTLYEPTPEPLQRSRKRIEQSVAAAVKGGKLAQDEVDALLARISWTTALEELGGSEVVIEAAIEELELKRELFRRIDAAVPDASVIASNTSSIPIAPLAAVTSRPERVCGLHFFSPVPVMRLVEIVVGLDTSEETIAAADSFVAELRKHAVYTKDRSGFIVNFLLVPYLTSAVRMLEDGFATREDIDEGMRLGCGHPMGPLTLCDYVGLDVLEAVCGSLYEEFKEPHYAPPVLLRRMVSAGRLGRKSGRGFYDYEASRERAAA